MSGWTRRSVLGGALALAGAARAQAVGKRVVVLDWALTELALLLGVTPIAVAEAPYYRMRVATPDLPAEVADVGLRAQPNLALIASLKPDLIVRLRHYGPPQSRLEAIAPTLELAIYEADQRAYERATDALARMGEACGAADRTPIAMSRIDATLAHSRETLAPHFDRPVLIANFADDRRADVFGRGSLFQSALERVGLSNAYGGPTNMWGFATLGLDRLARFDGARLVALSPGPPAALAQSALWGALPAFRDVVVLPPVWVYGGLASMMRFATLLSDALGDDRAP
ncbi:ABC transporter substrate-binding protein [Hansschlegelia quercus]|uniref:ABC transporter substrate-binding protein n=1 Tax=Hansschlegelia quercus TaxID=2528245 RepID=UPI0013EF19BB|nr:ABC transporter substrate-binding protein [Hansschlegelia quercus]